MTTKDIIRTKIEARMEAIDEGVFYADSDEEETGYRYALEWIKGIIDSLPDEPKGWISVKDALPPMDEEVIVLTDNLETYPICKICFGHIVDRARCSDYNGWNIPGVVLWMPCPKLPETYLVASKNWTDEPTPPEKCEETEKSALKKCEEVDLEKELAKYEASLPESATVDPFEGHPTLKDIASYFYELGKQAKKEE